MNLWQIKPKINQKLIRYEERIMDSGGVNNTYEEEGLADEFLQVDGLGGLQDDNYSPDRGAAATSLHGGMLKAQDASWKQSPQKASMDLAAEADPRLSNIGPAQDEEEDSDLQDSESDDGGDLQKQIDQIKSDLGRTAASKARALEEEGAEEANNNK